MRRAGRNTILPVEPKSPSQPTILEACTGSIRVVNRLFFKDCDFLLGFLLNVVNRDCIVHDDVVLDAHRLRLTTLEDTVVAVAVQVVR